MPDTHPPHSAGLCRFCLREVWRGKLAKTGLVAADDRVGGVACGACAKWCLDHPGEDPRNSNRTHAEQVPAERAEVDRDWRHDPRRQCVGADPILFDPDPDKDDPAHGGRRFRATVRDARIGAAARLCGPCPVRDRCRAAALTHGYEGLFGGVFSVRYRWTDLLTGEQGWTVHAPVSLRESRHLPEFDPTVIPVAASA